MEVSGWLTQKRPHAALAARQGAEATGGGGTSMMETLMGPRGLRAGILAN